MKFAHGFEPHGGSCIVKSEHVGGEIHEHGSVDGMSVGYFREDASEERCNAAREGVDHSSLLPDVENAHPQCENASKSDRNFKSVLCRSKCGVEDFGENIALSKAKKLNATHYDCKQNKSYPNKIQKHIVCKVMKKK